MSVIDPGLPELLFALLPEDGQVVGNVTLLAWLQDSCVEHGLGVPDKAAFEAARLNLVEAGRAVKGRGRGGSTARVRVTGEVQALPNASEGFALDGGSQPAELPASVTAAPRKAASAGPRLTSGPADAPPEVLSYRHSDRRKNNPEVGLVNELSDPQQPKKVWDYNPHLDPVLNFDSARAELETLVEDALASGDEGVMRAALEEIRRRGAPYLQWTGKAERTSFEVDTVSLHVHERIDPMSILSAVRKELEAQKKKGSAKNEPQQRQASLFEAAFESLPLRDAVDFYRHDKGWANRLVSGDSLQVMNSLLVKEGMAGQVQMIYIDPPYGIKYGSNFQPFVGKRDVKDRADADLTQEPEMIKAFRDTWELGIHSYLTYLRDRLLTAKDLLKDDGSVFVQIGDENLHHARELLDEVFGPENFSAQIAFKATDPLGQKGIPKVYDHIIWYAKKKSEMKFHAIYKWRDISEDFEYKFIDPKIGQTTPSDRRSSEFLARVYRRRNATSSGFTESCTFDLAFQGGMLPPPGRKSWSSNREGMSRLIKANRMFMLGKDPYYKQYQMDFPLSQYENCWTDKPAARGKNYVVETAEKFIERCMLMVSDPGDIVFDPTCGSGTTAYVAEKWGRRWITCDTSRVAITLAKQRLMTAGFDYYELAYPQEGLKGGFIYKTVPHITLGSIAKNTDIDTIYERLHPAIEQALTALNQALAQHPPTTPLNVTEGVRKGQKLHFSGKKPDTLHEWEVPFPGDGDTLPTGWEETLRAPFLAFHTARQRMQAEMDRAIAAQADSETLYDQPEKSKHKLRITGPFSVEAVPFPTVLSLEAAEGGATDTPSPDQTWQHNIARSGETSRQQQWRDELQKTGIRGKGGQMLHLAELEVLSGTTCLHASGTLADTGERVVVSFGPEHGALEQRQVEHALNEAGELMPRPKMVVFCAFTFDPEAAKDIDATRWAGVTLLKVQMNTDLLTEDLKKARASNQSFWLMGQPDVSLSQGADGLWQIEVNGFDYFDTVKGELISGGKGKIAMWSLDTDYDGRSLFPRQVFFPMAGKDEGWRKLKKTIRAELDETLLEQFHGTVSLPFEAGAHGRAAVKIVDDRGIESLKILNLRA